MGSVNVNTINDAAGTGGVEVRGNIGGTVSSAGMKGENFHAHTTSANDSGVATATFGNIFSLSITAGNYLGWATLQNTRVASQNESYAALSTNSGNTTTDHIAGYTEIQNTIIIGGADITGHYIGPVIYSTSGGFTVYLKGKQDNGTWTQANWKGAVTLLRT